MKDILKNRKTLFCVLSVVLVFVFTLTIAYAVLNTSLEISGNAEVLSASWDIYLDNVRVKNGSVSAAEPVITDSSTLSFDVDLNKPGDYYEFTVDVVNNGTIDAMIDSVVKLPQLTSEQVRYINYIIEYENGNSISTKQLVEKDSFVRFKVKVEYRKDISAADLPSATETLNLSFKVNYVQSDDSNNNVLIENNGKLIKVVSGDGTKAGDEVCIGEECFYVVSSTEETVTMLAKYNLLVGNKFDDTNGAIALENPTGIQDETAVGWFKGYNEDNPLIGTKPFSSTNYWKSIVSSYPSYVYNENSSLYEHVENYKDYLEGLGTIIYEARLITIEELEGLGCSYSNKTCISAPSWVYSTTYWTGVASSTIYIWYVYSYGSFGEHSNYSDDYDLGVRPVIVISRNLIL